eukprot:gene20244-26995_t
MDDEDDDFVQGGSSKRPPRRRLDSDQSAKKKTRGVGGGSTQGGGGGMASASAKDQAPAVSSTGSKTLPSFFPPKSAPSSQAPQTGPPKVTPPRSAPPKRALPRQGPQSGPLKISQPKSTPRKPVAFSPPADIWSCPICGVRLDKVSDTVLGRTAHVNGCLDSPPATRNKGPFTGAPKQETGLSMGAPKQKSNLTTSAPRQDPGLSLRAPVQESGPSKVAPGQESGPKWAPKQDSGPYTKTPKQEPGPSKWGPKQDSGPSTKTPKQEPGPSKWAPKQNSGPSTMTPKQESGPSVWAARDAQGIDHVPATTSADGNLDNSFLGLSHSVVLKQPSTVPQVRGSTWSSVGVVDEDKMMFADLQYSQAVRASGGIPYGSPLLDSRTLSQGQGDFGCTLVLPDEGTTADRAVHPPQAGRVSYQAVQQSTPAVHPTSQGANRSPVLKQHDLPLRYAQLFSEAEVNELDVLQHLSDQDLTDIGISDAWHRQRILEGSRTVSSFDAQHAGRVNLGDAQKRDGGEFVDAQGGEGEEFLDAQGGGGGEFVDAQGGEGGEVLDAVCYTGFDLGRDDSVEVDLIRDGSIDCDVGRVDSESVDVGRDGSIEVGVGGDCSMEVDMVSDSSLECDVGRDDSVGVDVGRDGSIEIELGGESSKELDIQAEAPSLGRITNFFKPAPEASRNLLKAQSGFAGTAAGPSHATGTNQPGTGISLSASTSQTASIVGGLGRALMRPLGASTKGQLEAPPKQEVVAEAPKQPQWGGKPPQGVLARGVGVNVDSSSDYGGLPKWVSRWQTIPGSRLVVDKFGKQTENIRTCTHWVLTHFHADHYMGLTKHFNKGVVVCTPVTAQLISTKLKVPWARIMPVALDTPTLVDGVPLTMVEANHCPGAAMVIAEPLGKPPVLHTGDCRLVEAMQQCQALIKLQGRCILVLDTTYCDPQYDFPPQEAVLKYSLSESLNKKYN